MNALLDTIARCRAAVAADPLGSAGQLIADLPWLLPCAWLAAAVMLCLGGQS